ncbi:MAG: hypothetical protein AAGJ38_02910 [Planctomycetota bacterium]
MKKRTVWTVALSLVLLMITGTVFVLASQPQSSPANAILWSQGSFGREYHLTAHSAIIDSDGEATVIHSGPFDLRFEQSCLLIDGYVAAPLTAEMRDFSVRVSDAGVLIYVDGIELVDQHAKNHLYARFTH